jgi:protein-S-isoprenylcysteine O-methyltransferase Ste14
MFASSIGFVIPALWAAWGVFWMAAALNTKPTRWRESTISRALHIIPLLLCAALLTRPRWFPPILTTHVLASGDLSPIFGVLLVAAGLALAAWARAHLGRNWSGTVTVKKDHALVRSGPYRVVRHPIYTGLLMALIGTALAIGEARGLLGVACALLGFLWKLHVEENRMRQTFPEYEDYRKRTSALIPLLY